MIGVSLVAFGGLYLANAHWQKQASVELLENASQQASALLMEAVRGPMAMGDDAGTAAQFANLGARFPGIQAYLLDSDGEVTYATQPHAVRKKITAAVRADELDPLLESVLGPPREATAGRAVAIDGTPFFLELTRVPNEDSCHHCHGDSRATLGAMVMLQNAEPAFARIDAVQQRSALLSLGGMAVLLVVLGLFLRYRLVQRIRALAETADAVEEGELNVTFPTAGDDELGRLGRRLQSMVKSIRDQLEYNRGVLQSMTAPLFVTDAQGVITFCNEPLARALDMDREDVLGRRGGEFVRDPEAGDVVAQALASCNGRDGFVRHKRSDDVVVPLRYEISPICDAEGEVTGVLGVFMDLTSEEQEKNRIRAHGENLQLVGDQVMEVAKRLARSAEELSAQMDDLTGGVEHTARQTDDLAMAMEQMNGAMLEVAGGAGEVASESEEARQVAAEGGEEVKEAVARTRDVAARAERLAASLSELDSRAENIGAVVSVINEIADQTNLLALNAAIEAARAGESGRGFAVVADEVRKLAERTMGATQEVESVVGEIQSSAREAVSEMSATKEIVEESADRAGKAVRVLEEIVSHADAIASKVRNIAAASQEQSDSSQSMNANVAQINQRSQDGARRIEEANAAISVVAEISKNLDQLVELFRQDRRFYPRIDLRAFKLSHKVVVERKGRRFSMALVDISAGGARLRYLHEQDKGEVQQGEIVTFFGQLRRDSEFPESIQSEVRWTGGPLFGVLFARPVDLGVRGLKELLDEVQE